MALKRDEKKRKESVPALLLVDKVCTGDDDWRSVGIQRKIWRLAGRTAELECKLALLRTRVSPKAETKGK